MARTISRVDIYDRLWPRVERTWDQKLDGDGKPVYGLDQEPMFDPADIVFINPADDTPTNRPSIVELEAQRGTVTTAVATERNRRFFNLELLTSEDIHDEVRQLIDFLASDSRIPTALATRAQTLKQKMDAIRAELPPVEPTVV